MYYLLFGLLVLSASAKTNQLARTHVSSWWNPFTWFDDAVNDIATKLDQVVQGAGAVFTRVLDDTFQREIVPLVNQIQAFIRQDINQINNDIQQTIDHAENSTKSIVAFAEQQAEKFVNVSIAAMEKAVEDAMGQVQNLVAEINQDLSGLLDKLADILSKLHSDFRCDYEELLLEMYAILSGWVPTMPGIECRYCLDNWIPISEMSLGDCYNLRKCIILRQLNVYTSSILDICQAYIDIQRLALQMVCANSGSGPAKIIYGQDWYDFGEGCNIWLFNTTNNYHWVLQKHLALVNTSKCFLHKKKAPI